MELIYGGLNVNVGRTDIHSLRNDVVDELNYGSLFCQLFKLLLPLIASEEALYCSFASDRAQQAIQIVVATQIKAHLSLSVKVAQRLPYEGVQGVPCEAPERAISQLPKNNRLIDEPIKLNLGSEETFIDANVIRQRLFYS